MCRYSRKPRAAIDVSLEDRPGYCLAIAYMSNLTPYVFMLFKDVFDPRDATVQPTLAATVKLSKVVLA
jgi:hypothetical protein